MNSCNFSGRLVRDSETRFSGNGTAITNFTLAVDSGFGENKKTAFVNCVMFKKESLGQHLTKGKPVIVYDAEFGENKWQDKDGNQRSTPQFVVFKLDFQQGDSGQRQQQRSGFNSQQQDSGPAFPSEASGMDEIPF